MVAFPHVFNLTPSCDDHAGGFVTEQSRQVPPGTGRASYGVQLRMANPAGKQFNQHLIRAGIGKFDFIDNQRFLRCNKDCRPTFYAHTISSLVPLCARSAKARLNNKIRG
jgi:hypothetical protein